MRKLIAASVLALTAATGLGSGSAMASMMEIDIEYYSDADHTVWVGAYYKGCDGKVLRSGSYSDFYIYQSSPCD